MNYRIVFDTSTDVHSAARKSVTVTPDRLAAKIIALQARGYIVYSVRKQDN